MPVLTYRDAINRALDEELAHDENVVIIGEEVAQYNGAYKVTEGLWEKWGDKRVVDAPISEAGFIGMGIGASMLGVRPVMELMFWSFAYVAFDQMINNAGCVRYMSGGLINVPIVVRGPANGGTQVGATHSHTPENFIANTPGLKVVCPSNAHDAMGLMKSAIRDNDPVYVMESTLLYGDPRASSDIPDDEEVLVPLGVASVKRLGSHLTLVAWGRAVIHCMEAAEILANDHDISAEVIDVRSIRPLDEDTILESVRKTSRCVVVEENKPFCGVGAQIASTVGEKCFDHLDAPVGRLSAIDAPAIYSKPLEDAQLRNPADIVEKVLALF